MAICIDFNRISFTYYLQVITGFALVDVIWTCPIFSSFWEIKRPDKKLRRVVLPAPEAPMMLKNCPGKTDPLTPSRMTFGSRSFFLPQQPACGFVLITTSFQLSWILVLACLYWSPMRRSFSCSDTILGLMINLKMINYLTQIQKWISSHEQLT